MRKLTCWLILVYVCVILGVTIELPGALGSVIRLSQFAALAMWLGSLVVITRKIRRPHPLHIMFGLVVLWDLMTYLWSADPIETLLHFSRSLMVFLMTFAIWDTFRSQRQERNLRQVVVFAGYILVGICLFNFRSGAGKELDESRFWAGALDPNDMGLILAVIIPIAWQLFLDNLKRRSSMNFLNVLYPLVAMAGIMLSGSRGSIVAALPAFIFIACTYRRLPAALRVAIPVVLIAGIAFAARAGLSSDDNVSKNLTRLATITESVSGDKLSGRTEIWAAGWDVFKHNPFVGIGYGAFPEATRRYPVPRHPITGEPYVAHNTYLSILTETGVIGFGLFAAAVLVALRCVWKIEADKRGGWIATIACLLLGIVSLSWDFRAYIWIFLTIAVAASTAQREGARSATRSALDRTVLPNIDSLRAQRVLTPSQPAGV